VEPGTPSPQKRLEVCRTLNDAGIPCGVLMAPVLPYLSDSPEQLRATVRAIAEAGAVSVTPLVLHLRPGAREWYAAWLQRHHPQLLPRYEALYGDAAYAPRWYQRRITRTVHEIAAEYGCGPSGVGGSRRVRPAAAPEPAIPGPAQLTLL
jgi:DNA repair photolyase